jgi:hypothetical protein
MYHARYFSCSLHLYISPACEDALLLRLARSSHFRCRSTPSSSEPRPEAPLASLAQWAAAKAAERHQAGGQRQSSLPSSLPPSYLLSLPGSSAEPRPEQLFAAATLEALQAPPAVSGITASEVQLALQLSLQQMVSGGVAFSLICFSSLAEPRFNRTHFRCFLCFLFFFFFFYCARSPLASSTI